MKKFELTQAEYEEDGVMVTGRYLLTGRPTTLHEATETFLALEQVKKQTFIAQGFILRVVRDDCLYQQAGYVDINSYAKGELGLGKEGSRVDSIVNRYININKRFSSGGYSAVIDDRYMNYSYSALSEIWTMTDEEIESAGITETTTVAKIREIKRENREDEPEEDEQIPGQTEITDFLPDATGSEGSEQEEDGSVATLQQEEKAENRINTPAEGHFEGENGQNGQHNVENGRKETVEMPENRINTLADVNPEAVEKEEQKTEKEEVLEAEVLKRSPEYLHLQIDLSGYGNEMTKDRRIEDAFQRITEPLKNITQREVRAFNFAIDFIEGVTKARTLLRLYNEEKRQAERQQDELPDMKNNDQRREFIGTYRSWPLWSENKKTKERFYRYEFQNGDAFIIKDIYSNRERYDLNKHKNVRKAEWTKQAGFIMKKGELEELNDCVASETVMIDYLREMKKKG